MKPTFKINGQEFQFGDITLRTYYGLKEVLAKGETREAEFEIVQCMTGCPAELLKLEQYWKVKLRYLSTVLVLPKIGSKRPSKRPVCRNRE
jgi:hypothetical protein